MNNKVGVAIEADVSAANEYCPERIADLQKRACIYAGLGQRDESAPLRDIVSEQDTVLIKPNWVTHRHEGGKDGVCLITHENFIRGVVDEVIKARPRKIILGDAPIQSCRFNALLTEKFREAIAKLGQESRVNIEIVDFRRTIAQGASGANHVHSELRDNGLYTLFDLKHDSLLEQVTDSTDSFRVQDYDPGALARTHRSGVHQYLLCKEAFTADVVISLPKLKTHGKAGLTGAIKNLVGLNGNKDYLPHHRFGGSSRGGDNYQGGGFLRNLAEILEDGANRRIGTSRYAAWQKAYQLMRLVSKSRKKMGGCWHGNDTVWRMALDLNRIILYGDATGKMHDSPQRKLYSFTDAIVCGQGNGPLRPDPLFVGAVTFSSSAVAAELAHAALLMLEPSRLPILREALGHFRWPLVEQGFKPEFVVNGSSRSLQQIATIWGQPAVPPDLWKGRVEYTPDQTFGYDICNID